MVLHSGKKYNLNKWNHLAKDKPDVDHFDVRGGSKPFILLMKMVVITSMVVRFTPRAASKKKGLKKVVAKVIAVKRSVGKYVVNNSLIIFRFKTIFIFNVVLPLF